MYNHEEYRIIKWDFGNIYKSAGFPREDGFIELSTPGKLRVLKRTEDTCIVFSHNDFKRSDFERVKSKFSFLRKKLSRAFGNPAKTRNVLIEFRKETDRVVKKKKFNCKYYFFTERFIPDEDFVESMEIEEGYIHFVS